MNRIVLTMAVIVAASLVAAPSAEAKGYVRCVYHVAHQGLRGWFSKVGQNVETENFTQALYDARELAMERMQSEAQAVQPEGIVGVQIQERSHGWGSHVIEFYAVGTAVVPTRAEHEIAQPALMLSLDS
jgi:uncharacterized protein YbjQ (UPF0145 family)